MQAWPVLEPATPFRNGIHMRAICRHLPAITEGRLRHLIINVPPGHAKSLLTGVFWPARVWIDPPHVRWLFASYAATLRVRDSVKCRRLIESDWYQHLWGDRYQLTGDQNQKNRFEKVAPAIASRHRWAARQPRRSRCGGGRRSAQRRSGRIGCRTADGCGVQRDHVHSLKRF